MGYNFPPFGTSRAIVENRRSRKISTKDLELSRKILLIAGALG
jgi:hypothetical protein